MLFMSQMAVFLLMADAAYVAYGLLKKKNMWMFIVLYWIILTYKNMIDLLGLTVLK